MAQFVAIRALNRSANIRVTASNNVYHVTVDATSGQFKIKVDNQADGNSDTTADIAFNALASTVKTAVAALTTSPDLTASNISVTGGPGDSGGTTPYVISIFAAAGDQDFVITSITGTTPLAGGGATTSVVASGRNVKLSTTVDTVVDLDRASNVRSLRQHSAIGQYIITAANGYDGTDALPTNS